MSGAAILVDADACPVKEQIYAAAYRHKIPVTLYAATWLRHPDHPLITMRVAGDGFDAADDLVVADARPGVLVITADLPLADRALKAGAMVMDHQGAALTEANIGGKLATRDLMADLRGGLEGQGMGGPKPFSKSDRSAFANALENALRKLPR